LSNENGAVKRRTATLKLLEDGTLEGDMSIMFTGHWNILFKEQEDDDTAAEREQAVKDLLGSRLPGAEITNVSVENVTDRTQPYVNKWHVRVPGYAQKTGSRLFLQPAAFQRGLGPTLTSATRTRDIYFHFAWSENDFVTLDLPDGYTLEAPDAPAGVSSSFGSYEVQMGVDSNGRKLVYRRRLVVGRNGQILFKAADYAVVKQFFDLVDRNDGHTLALRKAGAQ
jgi:hypothetical protein